MLSIIIKVNGWKRVLVETTEQITYLKWASVKNEHEETGGVGRCFKESW